MILAAPVPARHWRGLLLGPMLAACGGSATLTAGPAPAPVKVEGSRAELRHLAGTWRGGFQSRSGDRRGTIFFDLRVDSDTAFGSITLEAPAAPTADCVDPSHPVPPSKVVAPIVLQLGGVAASEAGVGGWIRPYCDPQAGSWIDTWFEGRFVRDSLVGSYFRRRTDVGDIGTGTWWAARAVR